MPSLNIKNIEAYQLAKELAKRNGETVTMAVTIALKERLEREQSAAKKEGRLQWLLDMTKEAAAMRNDGKTSKELIDELYDPETGLPV